MKTKQEIFNKIVNHLRQQGQSAQEDDICKYRTLKGHMCAVGCLIADEAYFPDLEDNDVNHPPILNALCGSGISADLVESCQLMLYDFQNAHDEDRGYLKANHQTWYEHMEEQYTVIAAEHKLVVPEPINYEI